MREPNIKSKTTSISWHLQCLVPKALISINITIIIFTTMTDTYTLTHRCRYYLQVKSEVLSLLEEVVQNEFPHKVWV